MLNHRRNSLARRNYIANNLQNSQVEVCFCAWRNTPVDLAKVYFLDSFAIQRHCNIYEVKCIVNSALLTIHL